jgi:hypothetical protein
VTRNDALCVTRHPPKDEEAVFRAGTGPHVDPPSDVNEVLPPLYSPMFATNVTKNLQPSSSELNGFHTSSRV